jgi:hypothetical protein
VQEIAALVFGDRSDELLPFVRIERGSAAFLVQPVELVLLEQEDTAKDQLGNPLGVRLGVGERERGAPASAERLPFLDPGDLGAELLDVLDKVPGGVVLEVRERGLLAATALVEHQDLVLVRVELPAVVGARCAARSAVKEDHGLAVRIAA